MLFYLAYIVIALACSVVTIKTLVGYADIKRVNKIIVSVIIITGWLSSLIIKALKYATFIGNDAFSVISNTLYTLMGFVFILFVIIMLRDIVWYMIFYSLKLFKIDAWYLDPRNLSALNKANMLVVFIAVLISVFSFYEGHKIPTVEKTLILSSKISRSLRIAQISDLHITRASSNNNIIKLINEVNAQNPDVIVLTGDIIDDNIAIIDDKIALLSRLSAPYGVYAIMGNHEFYNDVYAFKSAIENNQQM